MKNELGGRIMKEFIALRPKMYLYLTDDDMKAKGTKKYVMKYGIKYKDYKDRP